MFRVLTENLFLIVIPLAIYFENRSEMYFLVLI